MSSRKISNLGSDLTQFLFDLGERIAVLVEGKTDQNIFEDWFPEHLSTLFFFSVSGVQSIEKWMYELTQRGIPVFAIIDRDFRPASEVISSLTDPNSRQYILTRYEIENYLLETLMVWETLSKVLRERFQISNPEHMQKEITALCGRLKTLAAANWVLWEHGKAEEEERLSIEHDVEREAILGRLFKMLGCSQEEAESKLLAKEVIIELSLNDLNEIHTYIRGKSIIHHLHKNCIKDVHPRESLGKSYFMNFLIDRIALSKRIPADIRFIVEQKILGLPAQPGT